MLRCLILCLMLPGCFGPSDAPPPTLSPAAQLADPTPIVDPALYDTCPGWTGGPPALGLELMLAAETEIACRRQMAGQLDTLAKTHGVR